MKAVYLPDCLKDIYSFEKLLLFRSKIYEGKNPVVDLSDVHFIEPYSLLGFLLLGRKYFRDTGNKIVLRNINIPVYQYLSRMNFTEFNVFDIYDKIDPKKLYKRTAFSRNVVEITEIPNRAVQSISRITEVIELFRKRAEFIMNLRFDEKITDDFVTVISELSQNIFEHALDSGFIAIQTYSYQKNRIIRFVISDSGVGIEGSFAENEKIVETGAELIQRVLTEPISSKRDYGYGLCRVADIVKNTSGNIYIRSNNSSGALVLPEKKNSGYYYFQKNNIPVFNGTQISITLKV